MSNEDIPWKESSFHAASQSPAKQDNDNNSGDDDENNEDVFDMFADPDPYQMFEFDFCVDANLHSMIHIQLQGQKQENGQTLHSTGLTLWNASELVCGYLVAHQDFVKDKRVLEVRRN
jgi:hypothetical protein